MFNCEVVEYAYFLVGGEEEYFERSPINFVDKFSCPIILFQGLEDKVCVVFWQPFLSACFYLFFLVLSLMLVDGQ